jgi:hypothetical protein
VLWKEQATVGDGRPHALAAFPHGCVGQANEGNPFQATGNIDFDIYKFGI